MSTEPIELPEPGPPTTATDPGTADRALVGIGMAAVVAVVLWAWLGDDWRVGVTWIAASLLAAAGLRLVLPERDAGMLAVRHRLLDVFTLGSIGGVLLFLARTIPNQPGS